MGNRGSQSVSETNYKWLVATYGETCLICKSPPPPGQKLQVDHISYDPDVIWDPDNISLVCGQCNIYFRSVDAEDKNRPRMHRKIIEHYRALRMSERAREREKQGKSSRQGVRIPGVDNKIAGEFGRVARRNRLDVPVPDYSVKAVLDYMNGSAEMKANSKYQPSYAVWVWKELLQHGPLPEDDLLDSGANDIGANQTTLKRYLKAWYSRKGALERADDCGIWKVYFKDPSGARNVTGQKEAK